MPHAFGDDERVTAKSYRDVMVPTRKATALVVVEPELSLQILVDTLGSPALHDEANELLVERGGLALDPDEVEVLREQTEGWPGALYLALLWLRGVENPHEAVREFGGDHRFVADYLNHEILGSLDETSRLFLLRTSVLGQFTAGLCDSVFEQ